MNTSAVRHLSFYPFVQALARSEARFSLEAAADDLSSCELVWWKRSMPEKKQTAPMQISISDRCTDQCVPRRTREKAAQKAEETAALRDLDCALLPVGGFFTVGPEEAPMQVHLILLGAGAVLLEGIRLGAVEEGACFLHAAPLNLAGAEGAPCRATLIRE